LGLGSSYGARMTAPDIQIYVRHSAGCKYKGDYAKRCTCRKWIRWSCDGKRTQIPAETRSWAEAEEFKRKALDRLAGRVEPTEKTRDLQDGINVFLQDKQLQGVTQNVIAKYTLLLSRLRTYCTAEDVFTIQGIDRELITGFCSTWDDLYPSSITRSKLRERLRSFLRYCYEAKWLDRIPVVPKFKIDEPETQPLTPGEYARLLAAIRPAIAQGDPRRKTDKNNGRRSPDEEENQYTIVHAFLQGMRWTGLAIRDTLTLPRVALEHDVQKDLYRVTTKRAKTGTPVSVPIPHAVADELLAAHKLNSNPRYFFWSGEGLPQSATSNWGQRYIAPVFKQAGIVSDGNMLSHRLRDTFAVDLLEKGVPMEEVSRLLGHTSIRTTEKSYAKWSKGRQDRADSLVVATWNQSSSSSRSSSSSSSPSE
jgi:integrase/recombinase XerD